MEKFTLIPFLTGIFSDDTSQGIFPPDVLQYASENTSLHTDFKLTSSGETIYLKDNSGNLDDSLSFENYQ